MNAPHCTRLLVCTLAALLLLPVGLATAQTVSLSTQQAQVRVGVPFELVVSIDQATSLYAVVFDLTYDESILRLVDVNSSLSGTQPQIQLGAGLNPGGGQPSPLSAAGEDQLTDGQAPVGLSRHSVATGLDVDSPSELLTLLFVANQEGNSTVDFTANSLRDDTGTEIAGVTWQGVQINAVPNTNSPPTQPSVAIAPGQPITSDALECQIVAESTDDDGDDVTYTYAWYKDDELQADLTTAQVPADRTARGETWRCIVTPNDGTDPGLSDEDSVVIRNAVPSIASVLVSPEAAYEATTLMATVNGYSDADNDPEMPRYQWMLDQVGPIAGATGAQLTGDDFDKLDVVYCRVTPYDGFVEGDTVESNKVTIANSTPEIAFDPQPPYSARQGVELTFSVSTSDDDPADRPTLSLEGSPPQTYEFDPGTGIFSLTPDFSVTPGVYSIMFASNDGTAIGQESVDVDIKAGDAPTDTPTPIVTATPTRTPDTGVDYLDLMEYSKQWTGNSQSLLDLIEEML